MKNPQSNGQDSEMIPLGEIASCQYGLSKKANPDGERLYIGMGQLRQGQVVAAGSNRLSPSSDVAEKYGLRIGDVLFNRTNSLDLVGKTAIVRDEKLVGAVFASYLVRLVVDPSRYDPRFLNLWMNSNQAIARLRRLATPGVAQFNIRPSLLADKFLVPRWPIVAQQACADLEELFEDACKEIDRLIDAKTWYKMGLMQQLLTGQKRFPEFVRSSKRQPSEFGTLPKDWRAVPIGKIAVEAKQRGTIEGAEVYSCTKHEGLVLSKKYFGKQVFSRNLENYKRVEVGDFAYATNHIEEGSIGLLRPGNPIGLVSPMYTVFRSKKEINPEFLFSVLKAENYRRVFQKRTNASVNRRGSLRWSEFSKILVPVPTRPEQDRIAEALALAQQEIDLLKDLRQLNEKYKKGLLSRLLSGELELPAP